MENCINKIALWKEQTFASVSCFTDNRHDVFDALEKIKCRRRCVDCSSMKTAQSARSFIIMATIKLEA